MKSILKGETMIKIITLELSDDVNQDKVYSDILEYVENLNSEGGYDIKAQKNWKDSPQDLPAVKIDYPGAKKDYKPGDMVLFKQSNNLYEGVIKSICGDKIEIDDKTIKPSLGYCEYIKGSATIINCKKHHKECLKLCAFFIAYHMEVSP